MIKLQPPPSPVARVLVVEDDAELRDDILVPGLAGFGFATEGVASAEALYRRFVAAPSELVVLDIGLPQEDGLSAAAHLRQARGMAVGIVMLAGMDSGTDQVRGLEMGADAYLAKPVTLDVLAATLHSVLRRLRAAAAPRAAEAGGPEWQLDADGWGLRASNGRKIPLTQLERSILSCLLARRGEAVSRETLIAELGGDADSAFDPHRLEMIIHRLRRKTEEQLGLNLPLRAVRGVGYVFARPGA